MSKSDFQKILERVGETIKLEKNTSKKISRQLMFSDIFYLSALILSSVSYGLVLVFYFFYSLRDLLNLSTTTFNGLAFPLLVIFLIFQTAGVLLFFLSFARSLCRSVVRIYKRDSVSELSETFALEEGYYGEGKNIAREILKGESEFAKSVDLTKIKQTINIFEYKINLLEKGDITITEISKSITPIILGILVFLSLFGFPVSEISKLNLLPNKDMAMSIATLGLTFNLLIPVIKITSLNRTRLLRKCLCILQQIAIILEEPIE